MIMPNWTPAAEGAGFELTPTLEPLAPFREQLLVLSGLNCIPTPGTARRCSRQGQHAVPDRRIAADQRNLSSTPASRWTRSWQGTGQAHTARVARAGHRVRRHRGRLRRRASRAPTPTPSRGAAPTRRCRCRTIRARCSNGCSATAAAPIRRRGWRACSSSAACSTR